MRESKMATIKDIAQKLGISVSTVSKGLNGASDISDDLRQLVLDTAVQMGYSTKRSKKVEYRKLCLFVENMEYETLDSFGYDIILGFKQNAFRHKWDVTVISITPQFQQEEKYDTYLLKHGYCGAFLLGLALQDPWMKQLHHTTMPTVLFDNFIDYNPNVCYLGTDSYEGIRMAVQHLSNLGHKKIGFINGSPYSLVTDQRHEAFRKSMAEFNLPINEKLLVHGYFVSASAKYHVPGFLEEGATAIVCGNDLIAQGVIEYCTSHGYRVPEDVSVIGFDNIPIAATTVPPLTTIAQQRNELGKSAYVILNSLILHISIGKMQLRPKLIERESTTRVYMK
ncbi:MAG: LacI family DNA-binding transcriptional regulator [Lachnospiraceae bacterium]|nr:LacI family DNA-binding transcriptional regulator [Lachnospiraceae bacterium]